MATDTLSQNELEAIADEVRRSVATLETEGDAPKDVFSEKQQRLLTEPLHSSWAGPGEGRPFVAMANVGLFFALRQPPLVPDTLLSLDVTLLPDVREKHGRSYFVWEYGKFPEIVIKVVSNREGREDTEKLATYARIGIRYYVIFDPNQLLGDEVLRMYRLEAGKSQLIAEPVWFPEASLGLRLWEGRYEDMDALWLRWVDAQGVPIPTGKERADAERERAERERQRAERLAEQLRKLGAEPHEE